MEFIKGTQDNTFVGSTIKVSDELYFVYKVNKTFVWAGKKDAKTIISLWKDKSRKEKWVDLMKRHNAKKISYDFEVKVEEIKHIDERKFKNTKKKKRYLKSCCEKEIDVLYKRFREGKPYRYPVECKLCSNRFHAINCSDDGLMMLSSDYVIFFFDVRTREYHFFRNIGEDENIA